MNDEHAPPTRSTRSRGPLRAWWPALAWAGLILTLGGAGYDASQTSRWIGPLLAWLLPDADPELRAALHGAIRKAAHLAEYAVLGALAARASLPRLAPALLFGLALALFDEGRQTLLPERSGSPVDVGIDLAGHGAGLYAMIAARRLRAARSERSE